MNQTCRLFLLLAALGWFYTGCEQHELTETHVLYSYGHDAHGDDHGHDKEHGDDHGHKDEGHGDDHGHDKPKGDDHGHKGEKAKSEAPAEKEEPRNLGI